MRRAARRPGHACRHPADARPRRPPARTRRESWSMISRVPPSSVPSARCSPLPCPRRTTVPHCAPVFLPLHAGRQRAHAGRHAGALLRPTRTPSTSPSSPGWCRIRQRFATCCWVALFIGFAIKIPAFPFHTWLPDAHVEAPTAISVILAGVLLKMGTYGILRINYGILPEATAELAGQPRLLVPRRARRAATSSTARSAPWRRRTSRSWSRTRRSATWATSCSAWRRSRRRASTAPCCRCSTTARSRRCSSSSSA